MRYGEYRLRRELLQVCELGVCHGVLVMSVNGRPYWLAKERGMRRVSLGHVEMSIHPSAKRHV